MNYAITQKNNRTGKETVIHRSYGLTNKEAAKHIVDEMKKDIGQRNFSEYCHRYYHRLLRL